METLVSLLRAAGSSYGLSSKSGFCFFLIFYTDKEASGMEEIGVEIIRSDRKTVSVEVRSDLRVIVRAPRRMTDEAIKRFAEEKKAWIKKNIEKNIEKNKAFDTSPFAREEIQTLLKKAKEVLPVRTEKLSNAVGVKCGRLTVRSQISRWGSCSANQNISLNCLLVLCPPEVTDYVIIHELCHIRHMNHSRAFWRDVERFCPGYRSRREWLRKEGVFLIERLKKSRAQSSESASETGA